MKKVKDKKKDNKKDRDIQLFNRGKIEGRKEVIEKIVELLGLDERYEFKK